MNTLKTAFLLTALTLFLIFLGAHFGGRDGMILAFIIAAGMNFFSYFYSDKLALSMYKAQPVTREQLPRVYQIMERTSAPVWRCPCPEFMSSPAIRQTPLPPGATLNTLPSHGDPGHSRSSQRRGA